MGKVLVLADPVGAVRSRQAVAAGLGRGLARVAGVSVSAGLPLLNGGRGTLEALVRTVGGRLRRERLATGTRQWPASEVAWARLDDGSIYIEAAEALDPAAPDSRGLGAVLARALTRTPTQVVVGVGDAVANDAGRGVLEALGAGPDPEWPLRLATLWPATVPLVVLYDRALSFQAAMRHNPWPKEPARRDQATALAQSLEAAAQRALAQLPGSGCANGLALVLAALGGRLVPGAEYLPARLQLADEMARADWVLAAVHQLGDAGATDQPLAWVCREARMRGRPVVAVCYQLEEHYGQWYRLGLTGIYPLHERLRPPAVAWRRSAALLEAAAYRVGVWMQGLSPPADAATGRQGAGDDDADSPGGPA